MPAFSDPRCCFGGWFLGWLIPLAHPPGNDGYPIDPVTDCVDPVDPDDWLDAFTNTIEDADAMSVKGLTNNIPSYSSSEPPGNNTLRMCKKGY